jgi:hypothetical protein
MRTEEAEIQEKKGNVTYRASTKALAGGQWKVNQVLPSHAKKVRESKLLLVTASR